MHMHVQLKLECYVHHHTQLEVHVVVDLQYISMLLLQQHH
jgi:hypothetical protein